MQAAKKLQGWGHYDVADSCGPVLHDAAMEIPVLVPEARITMGIWHHAEPCVAEETLAAVLYAPAVVTHSSSGPVNCANHAGLQRPILESRSPAASGR